MFAGDKGTFLICFLTWVFMMYVWSFLVYNPLLKNLAEEETYLASYTRSELRMSNRSFAHMAAMGTWLGDAITLVMCADQIFQDYQQYPWWRPGLRKVWNAHRIAL